MEFLSATLEMIGSVLIGWAALRVHHRVLNERRIDKKVFRTMRIEQKFGMFGIGLVVLGYLLHVMG